MSVPVRRARGARFRRALPRASALLAIAAAGAAMGCGDDDSTETTEAAPTGPEQQALVEQLEERLRDSVNGETTNPGAPLKERQESGVEVETVDCPADVDLSTEGGSYDCELEGGGETGTVTVLTLGADTFNYGGDFAKTGEFGQGITLEPLEEEKKKQ